MKEKRYFAGANTTKGFVSYYNDIFMPCSSIYVIKGGSGTGKGRLIRDVADSMEADGADVEYFYCSFDPESLDGIIINGDVAVIDGTAPHVYEPSLPGVKENILDLGVFWNENELRARADEIRSLINMKKSCFDMAYSYLSVVGAFDAIKRKILGKHLKKDTIVAKASKMISEIKPSKKGKSGVRIISALGRKGEVRFDTFGEISPRNITLENKFGEGYLCLELIKKEAERFSLPVTVSYHPIYAGRINALMLGDDCAVYLDENEDGVLPEIDEINVQIKSLVSHAENWLLTASKTHFEIEKIYASAMDFEKKEEFTYAFINRLQSSKNLTNNE